MLSDKPKISGHSGSNYQLPMQIQPNGGVEATGNVPASSRTRQGQHDTPVASSAVTERYPTDELTDADLPISDSGVRY